MRSESTGHLLAARQSRRTNEYCRAAPVVKPHALLTYATCFTAGAFPYRITTYPTMAPTSAPGSMIFQ